MTTQWPQQLSDCELLEATERAAGAERRSTVELLRLLAELDARRLYLGEGCSSLFTYCTQVLHLSEHAAYHRIEAARAVTQFPVVLDRLSEGALTLTTDTMPVVRRLPAPTLAETPEAEPVARAPVRADDSAPKVQAVEKPQRAVMMSVAESRYLIRVTVSAETHAKLRRAQDLLRHAVPNGDPAAVLDRALTMLVDHLERTKVAKTKLGPDRVGSQDTERR